MRAEALEGAGDTWSMLQGLASPLTNLVQGPAPTVIPYTTEDLVGALRDSMDDAVSKKLTRMEVQFPLGLRLGFEGTKDELHEVPLDPTPERVARGDRELAAAVLVYSGEPPGLAVVFRTPQLVAAAKRAWQTWGKSTIVAMPSQASVTSAPPKKMKGGFASSGDADAALDSQPGSAAVRRAVDKGCKTLLMVAPREEQLQMLNELDAEIGKNLTILLLNARLHGPTAKRTEARMKAADSYSSILHMHLLQPEGRAILYKSTRSKPSFWTVARRTEAGSEFKEMTRNMEEPPESEILKTLAKP